MELEGRVREVIEAGLATLVAALLLFVRIGRNPRAEQGTKGYLVGEVERFDEREQVFSRGFLPHGSEQYQAFYSEHPQWQRGMIHSKHWIEG